MNLRRWEQEKPKKGSGFFSFPGEEGLYHPSTVVTALSVAHVELGVAWP